MTRHACLFFLLLIITGCDDKADPLGDIAQAKSNLLTCLRNQELPRECVSDEAKLRKAKLVALSAGHNEQTIELAEDLGAEGAPAKTSESPMQKVITAFEATWLPVDPEEFLFQLFSKQYNCSDVKSLIEEQELFIWSARGVVDGQLLFAFAPFTGLDSLESFYTGENDESFNSAPCLNIKDIEEGFAILSADQLSQLVRSTPIVGDMKTKYITFSSYSEASAYFDNELARHCLHVVPSEEGAEIEIKRDGLIVKNRTLVKAGEYSVNVSKPGYFPSSNLHRVTKPTRLPIHLTKATTVQTCEEANIEIMSTRRAIHKGNCSWEYHLENDYVFDPEYSIEIKNNNKDRLFAVEYLEESFEASGVKRKRVTLFSVFNTHNGAVSDGVTPVISPNLKAIEVLRRQGSVIEPGQLGRIDRKPILNSIKERVNRIRTEVLRYHFIATGAPLPARDTGLALPFSLRSGGPACTVE